MSNSSSNTASDPYDYESYVREPAQLFGRENELAAIQRLLGRRESALCLVLGGAHSGKTSLLRTLDRILQQKLQDRQQPLAMPCYTSPEKLRSLGTFCEHLIVELR